MDAEFFNPFDPRSPEGLIYQFRNEHCCSTSYDEIERSFKAIVAIHNMAREKREISRIVVRPGPKQVLWKYDFAYWIGRLWFNLFSVVPSSSPDGRFAEFIESMWASVDPNDSHPQNWDRTIRDVVGDLKSELNQ